MSATRTHTLTRPTVTYGTVKGAAYWRRAASELRWETSSPVLCLSKKAISWERMAALIIAITGGRYLRTMFQSLWIKVFIYYVGADPSIYVTN